MEIASKQEKVEFLEKILQIAKENSNLIPENGKLIFYDDFPAFDETCVIGIHLDEKKVPYFRIKGTFEANKDKIYNPEELLIEGKRYITKYLDKFKRSFFFYENNNDNAPDLLANLKK
jgi:hypothetical protein